MAEDLSMPLDVLLHVMRQHWREGRVDEAVELAKAAAPYLHARAGAKRGAVSGLATMEDEDLVDICRRGGRGTRSSDVDQE